MQNPTFAVLFVKSHFLLTAFIFYSLVDWAELGKTLNLMANGAGSGPNGQIR